MNDQQHKGRIAFTVTVTRGPDNLITAEWVPHNPMGPTITVSGALNAQTAVDAVIMAAGINDVLAHAEAGAPGWE